MISSILSVLFLLGAEPKPMTTPVRPPPTQRVDMGGISLEIPGAWQRRERAGTLRFDGPKGNAYFVVDTGEVKTAGMEPSVCLGKIIAALAEGGDWHRLVLGGFPAAHRSNTDVGKGGQVTVRTHTFVGCNGSRTWSILFHLDDKAAEEYEPQVVALAKSLEFTEGPPAAPPPGGPVPAPPDAPAAPAR